MTRSLARESVGEHALALLVDARWQEAMAEHATENERADAGAEDVERAHDTTSSSFG